MDTELAPLIAVPAGLQFASLQLWRDPVTWDYLYRLEPVEALGQACGILPGTLTPLSARRLILAWYRDHLEEGGGVDPIAQAWLEETGEARFSGVVH